MAYRGSASSGRDGEPYMSACLPQWTEETATVVAHAAYLALGFLSLIGLYATYRWANIRFARRRGLAHEKTMRFHPRLLYYQPGGEPLFLVDRSHEQSVFFLEGYRVQNPVGLNEEWLQGLYRDHCTNVIAPIIGKQSYPYDQRNADWVFQDDFRTALQIYDAYTNAMPHGHRIAVVGASLGAVAALTLATERRPHVTVLVSPPSLHLVLPENLIRSAEVAGRMLLDHMHLVSAFLPYSTKRWHVGPSSDPPTPRDHLTVPHVEWNMKQLAQLTDAIRWMSQLVDHIKGGLFVIVRGERDRTIVSRSMTTFVERLRSNGNRVETLTVPSRGHRLWITDDGREVIQRAILESLHSDGDALSVPELQPKHPGA